MLLATAAYALVSAIAADTFADSHARFALLDRLGVLPFLMFAIAPLVFGRDDHRDILLRGLVVVGAYLGTMAVLQGVGLDRYVFPSYISTGYAYP